jgi:riboflavin biosynthesis pyrimidine reductase
MDDSAVDFDSVRQASDIPPIVRAIYGTDLPLDAGVIHPTAVWRAPDDSYLTLKLNSETPPSRHDRFVLNLARARADALLTTGKILRDEPALVTDLIGDGPERSALLAWRREFLGRTEPPVVLVLTSGQNLDLEHPIFRGWAKPVLFTTHSAAEGLVPAALGRSIEVVSHENPSVHEALRHLRDTLECRTVSIEAGPTTSRLLYHPPAEVDELLLSIYQGSTLAESVRGSAFLSPLDIRNIFGHRSVPCPVEEPSGPWSFQRLSR